MLQNQNLHKAHQNGQVIHSGHFMISSVADDQEENEEILQADSSTCRDQSMMIQSKYDFSNVEKETKVTYQFDSLSSKHITIDSSLARLFKCMSLAYQGGKVISPKWKNFKGMKLTVKDKIRLNNAIWRTWHIQYIRRIKKSQFLIQFATPFDVDLNSHCRPEAVVLEGVYWKRRIETVVAEYKKWRAFFINKVIPNEHSPSRETNELELSRAQDELTFTDFTDTLFSSLSQQPFQFPHPREIAIHATNSDMIQPGLLQLQPSVDEFMDFDCLPELFSPFRRTTVSFSGSSSQVSTQAPSDYFPDSDLTSLMVVPNSHHSTLKPIGSTTQVVEFPGNGMVPAASETLPIISVSDSAFSPVNYSPVNNQNYPKVNFTNLSQPAMQGTNQPVLAHVQQYVDQQNLSSVQTQPQLSIVGVNVPLTQSICIINHQPAAVANQSSIVDQPAYSFGYKMTSNDPNKHVIAPSQTLQTMEAFQTIATAVPTQRVVQTSPHSQQDLSSPTIPNTKPASFLKQRKRSSRQVSSNNASLTVPTLRAKPPTTSPSSKSFTIPEKRRGLEEDQMLVATCESRDVWSLPNQRASPAAPQFITDVDMDHVTMDSSSTSLQDADLNQDDLAQSHSMLSNEQKRRFNIRAGFTRLQTLISSGGSNSNTKISKASMLNKTVLYIKTMQTERNKMAKEIETLKDDLEQLQASICASQSQLPATGALLPRHRFHHEELMFQSWVRARTKQQWKFFLFSKVIRPWFESYQKTMSATQASDFEDNITLWLRDNCSLRVLRSKVVHSLQAVSTSTSILTEPSLVRREIEESVRNDRT